MSRSLIERFYYGDSHWPMPYTPGAELVIEGPKREKQMISLAKHQIEAQYRSAREIANSNIANAHIIASEIQSQTEQLSNTIDAMGNMLDNAISNAASEITHAIDAFDKHICCELSEIKWQLLQQSNTLDAILEVLQQSRSNEARQLVNQGIRHYVNNEFDEAEERFRRALEYDTTDYQLLLNLSYIEIHKGNVSQAFTYLKKAHTLPMNLDSQSKARALWATARLYYAEKDYPNALSCANSSFTHALKGDAKACYDLGVYCALAGKTTEAISKIKDAITIDPIYFSKPAIDPDLQSIKGQVLTLLDSLVTQAENQFKDTYKTVEGLIREIDENTYLSSLGVIQSIHLSFNKVSDYLRSPKYTGLLLCYQNLLQVKNIVDRLRRESDTHRELAIQKQALADLEKQHNDVIKNGEPKKPEEGMIFDFLVPMITMITIVLAIAVWSYYKFLAGLALFLVIWLPTFFWLISDHFRKEGRYQDFVELKDRIKVTQKQLDSQSVKADKFLIDIENELNGINWHTATK